MKKVYIIGNNNNGEPVFDGGRIKIRLYHHLLQKANVPCDIIELAGWTKHPFRLFKAIKNAVKEEATILVMAGPNGCRITIPLVNKLNKKHRSRVVFCPLGIGTLDSVVKKLTPAQVSTFMKGEDHFGLKDESMKKNLAKLDLIIPQNEMITEAYRSFYGATNVRLLPNFRDVEITKRGPRAEGPFSIVFASRVTENKGVLDLMEAVDSLAKEGRDIKLDVYGERQLTEEENARFDALLGDRIAYRGTIAQPEMIQTLGKYDVFCLPTRYYGEGTPGALIEALIAGTPVLVSSYSQAPLLVEDGHTGVLFEFGNKDSLKEKIAFLMEHPDVVARIGEAGQQSSERFLFSSKKDLFLECICGATK